MAGYFSRTMIGFGVIAAIALSLPTKPAFAIGENGTAAAGEPSEAPQKYSVKRANPVANKRYFVEFRGRSAATYGHLYILFGELNARGEVVKSKIAVLYPAGDAQDCDNCSVTNWTIGHLIFVPSGTTATDGDLEEKYVTARYRVLLDKAQYQKLAAYVAKFQADPPLWNALFRNCVSFGKEIAELLGLQTPSLIWLKPEDFVNSLREMNGVKKEQEPLKDAGNAPLEAQPTAVAHQARAKHVASMKPASQPKGSVANASATPAESK